MARKARMTPDEALARAKELVAAGKVKIGNEAAKQGPRAVVVLGFSNRAATGIVFQWSRAGIGFGELTLAVRKADGKLHVDREAMSVAFCLDVLRQALEEAGEG